MILLKRFEPFLFLVSLILTAGCAHVISKDLRAQADPSLTLNEVRQNIEAYKGRLVIWGGEILQTINQKDGTTIIEVFQKSLGWRGEPKETLSTEGRFLILAEKYLDPYLYSRGKKITVAGEIRGERIKPIGEMDYRYPIVLSKEIYLWEQYYYPIPHYFDPYWGHPYWWRFHLHYYRYF